MEIRFDGQLVLVTGAAQGNGRALAEAFAAAGADVVAVDVRKAEVERVAEALREGAVRARADEVAGGGVHVGPAGEGSAGARARRPRAFAFALDIRDRAACRAVAAEVERVAGPVRHLVNNAGIDGRAELGSEEADAVWDAVIDVNLNGLYNMTSAFVDQVIGMRGTIVNVGSTMSFVGAPRMAAYTATKAAIHNFTQTLAIDLAPKGVRVNTLAPGLIETPLTAGLFTQPERLAGYLNRTCLGRAGKPEEITGAALFLCSEHASYMTGSTVRVDGGWLAR